MQRPVLVLYGPTASGKSKLAMEIARRVPATLINADSMQVYRDLPILTACPTPEEMAETPHRLFAFLDPASPFSAGQWLEAAKIAVYETWQENRLPVVVGGTGLYLKTLINGLSAIPEISAATRQRVRAMNPAEAFAYLQKHDPDMAVKLRLSDQQRILRAYEVLIETGHSLLYWQAQPILSPLPDADFHVFNLDLPRELLYSRCDLRLTQMLKNGALEELKTLLARNLPDSLPALRAVGVPELSRYLRGEWSLDKALTKAQQATRNYAKRQLTWARHQFPNAVPIDFPYAAWPDTLITLLHDGTASRA